MFGFFLDPSLTTPARQIQVAATAAGQLTPVCIYFGSRRADALIQTATGEDILLFASGSAGGYEAGHFRLGLSEPELAAAAFGAALPVGAALSGGPENALRIWIELAASDQSAGLYTGIDLMTTEVIVS